MVEAAPGIFCKKKVSKLTCHWTVGVGVPVAAAVNVAFAPKLTVAFAGFVVMTGALGSPFVVSVAKVVVALLTEFVKTAE